MTLKDLLTVVEIDTPTEIQDLQKMYLYKFDTTIEIPKELINRGIESIIPYENKLSIMIY